MRADDRRPLREQVADALHDMIRRGDIAPGERLQEQRLAEVLGVSRNPVREAIRALESTGLVDVRPNAGASVARWDADDLRELLEVRAALEACAAAAAADRHSPVELAEIDRSLHAGRRASKNGDTLAAADAHRDFHLAVETAAGNRHLAETLGPLRRRTELVFSLVSPTRPAASWDEHERTRDAIAAGDAAAAHEAALHHVRSVIAALSGGDG